ncbi:MAG: hypothetical protein ACLQBL_08635 [Polyangiaceae bacterium]|jgi:hypothetical protein
MRPNTIAGLALGFLVAMATLTPSRTARADEEFDVSVAAGKVTVTTKGPWHINKEYPWKVVAGDAKLDKSKFALDEKSASVAGVPKGTAKLKGAVCSGATCKPFEKDVTIQ